MSSTINLQFNRTTLQVGWHIDTSCSTCQDAAYADVSIVGSPTSVSWTGLVTTLNQISPIGPILTVDLIFDGVTIASSPEFMADGSYRISQDLLTLITTTGSHRLGIRVRDNTHCGLGSAFTCGGYSATLSVQQLVLANATGSSTPPFILDIPWWVTPLAAVGGVVLIYAYLVRRGTVPGPVTIIERVPSTVQRVKTVYQKLRAPPRERRK